MGWTGGIITFLFLWAFCLLVILPRGQKTQSEMGEVVPGTPPGAPAAFNLMRRLFYTTVVAIALWGLVALTVSYGWLTLEDFDFITPKSIREGAG